MKTPPTTRDVIRFGVFEVDLRSGELRKNGLKIKLQEQPFQVLVMLLRRPGEVVTREELQKAVWPADTFVDFDHGLNKTINKLREALDDTADNPRFVETLPRRGYRFIAPVDASLSPGLRPPSLLGGGAVTAKGRFGTGGRSQTGPTSAVGTKGGGTAGDGRCRTCGGVGGLASLSVASSYSSSDPLHPTPRSCPF